MHSFDFQSISPTIQHSLNFSKNHQALIVNKQNLQKTFALLAHYRCWMLIFNFITASLLSYEISDQFIRHADSLTDNEIIKQFKLPIGLTLGCVIFIVCITCGVRIADHQQERQNIETIKNVQAAKERNTAEPHSLVV